MTHPDRSYGRTIFRNTPNDKHFPMFGYADLSELIRVKKSTIVVAVNRYPEIFYPPDGYIRRPPRKAKPVWGKERFMQMWKLYKDLHP